MVDIKDGVIVPRNNIHPSCTENTAETRQYFTVKPKAASRFFSAVKSRKLLERSGTSQESSGALKIKKVQTKSTDHQS